MNKFIKVTPDLRYLNGKQVRININSIIGYYDYDISIEGHYRSVIVTTRNITEDNEEMLIVKESVLKLDNMVGIRNVLDPVEMD